LGVGVLDVTETEDRTSSSHLGIIGNAFATRCCCGEIIDKSVLKYVSKHKYNICR
jgi:hypothetical protein